MIRTCPVCKAELPEYARFCGRCGTALLPVPEPAQAEAAAPVSSPKGGEPEQRSRLGMAYGRLVYRLRWAIVALWLVILGVSAPFAAQLTPVLNSGGYVARGSESDQVDQALANTLHQPLAQLVVVFQSSTSLVSDPAYQQELTTFISRASAFPHVTSVLPGGVSQDARSTFVVVNFDHSVDATVRQLEAFRAVLKGSTAQGPAQALLTGNPAVEDEYDRVSSQDAEQADTIALPIALLVLLLIFGTLIAATMPIVLALVAVPVGLAIIYVIALHVSTSIFVLNVASIVGLGISIDYSLLLTRRFREELALGRPVREALGWTVALAGEAILFSGLTVLIGFTGLLLIGVPIMTSFGIGGMAVVGVAVLAALTLLPALLGIFGQRVNALRVPLVSRLTTKLQRAPGSGFWHGLALAVMRRPVMIALGVSVLLLGMGWPVFSMKVGLYDASELPPGSEARQGLHLLTTQFPAVNPSPVYVLVQTSDHSPILTQDTLSKVASLTDWLATQPHVTSLVSVTQVPGVPQSALFALYTSGAYQDNPDLAHLVANTTAGDTTLISLKSDAMLDSDAGKALIDHLRTDGKVQAHALRLSVGGFQATSLDFTRALYGQFPQAILFIVLATYLLLLLLFRSLLLPLKAILMNVLSVSAAYGVLVVVFQWGNLEGVLGFTSNGILSNLIPVLLFCVLFGLSMDYEVFLLSRIREEWLRTRDNRAAVAWGLEKTGGVITSAALLFVIIAGAFIFTSFIVTKQVGLGIAVAILVDATIIRLLLVPATMRLLGRWNWWLPGRFGRVSSPEHRE